MNTDLLADVIADCRYKPGWRITLHMMHGRPHIWVHAAVPNSNPPHEPVQIGHVIEVTEPDVQNDPDYCRQVIRDAIGKVEAHELGENLWFGDERPFMPAHGDEGNPYDKPL